MASDHRKRQIRLHVVDACSQEDLGEDVVGGRWFARFGTAALFNDIGFVGRASKGRRLESDQRPGCCRVGG